MTAEEIKNEVEFTRYADKLLEKINVHSKLLYGKNLTGAERVELAVSLLNSRASVEPTEPVKKGRK